MKLLKNMASKGQEEMIGFAMIVIIVSVILLVLIAIYINTPKTQVIQSYEADSFIQAVLQQTTICTTDSGLSYLSVQDLIAGCDSGLQCSDGTLECSVLNSTLSNVVSQAWPSGLDRPVKGYEMNITSTSANGNLFSSMAGNTTLSYKEGVQDLSKGGLSYSLDLRVYY